MTVEKIRQRLAVRFKNAEIEVRDDSALHAGHAGAGRGGHYHVTVCCAEFAECSPVQRHRKIQDVLADMFPDEIHALSIAASASRTAAAAD